MSKQSRLPPQYKAIKRNVYISKRSQSKFVPEDADVCQCEAHNGVGCTETCLNRSLFIECVGNTCPCGVACENQRLQKRQWAKISLHHFGEKGWGIVAEEKLVAGQLVVEYIGEVCNLKEVETRSKKYEKLGLMNTYIMNLNSHEVIDATYVGNYSRFINHSCNPNAECQKWTVKGEERIAIFATKDINIGEEVTYNYNLDWNGGRRVKCRCGASNCVGYLGAQSMLWRKTASNGIAKLKAPESTSVDESRSSGGDWQSKEEAQSPIKRKKRRLEMSPEPESPESVVSEIPHKAEVVIREFPLMVNRPIPMKYLSEEPSQVSKKETKLHPLLLSITDSIPLPELVCDPLLNSNQEYYMAVGDIRLIGIL